MAKTVTVEIEVPGVWPVARVVDEFHAWSATDPDTVLEGVVTQEGGVTRFRGELEGFPRRVHEEASGFALHLQSAFTLTCVPEVRVNPLF